MNYLVMECHPGYAVVLSEDGQFLKAANCNYEVGQTVPSIVPMQVPKAGQPSQRLVASLLAGAACLCLMALGVWQFLFTPYGSVRMQINPDLLMVVNRLDYVIELEGLNEDGSQLIEDYKFQWKTVEQVSGDLADRAVISGYLNEGGAIRLTVESAHESWRTAAEEHLLQELETQLGDKVIVTVVSSAEPPKSQEEPSANMPSSSISDPAQSESSGIPPQPFKDDEELEDWEDDDADDFDEDDREDLDDDNAPEDAEEEQDDDALDEDDVEPDGRDADEDDTDSEDEDDSPEDGEDEEDEKEDQDDGEEDEEEGESDDS